MRHIWASWLIQRKVPLRVLQEMGEFNAMLTCRLSICSHILRYCLIWCGIREMMTQICCSNFSRSVFLSRINFLIKKVAVLDN
ncbi:site-specific integrase [Neisseria musculi]|uniref:site-specific integrase n=1 Tax=Neisseria musculi TaxID=1815583 RepID=UPI001FE67D2B|nr:site-specific integrase [Neisseria musculi]